MSFLAQSLESTFKLQSDLAIELTRRNALLTFELSDAERVDVSSSKESLESLTTQAQALLDRCSQANLNLKDQDLCLTQMADLESRSREKTIPFELSTRL
ncbi:MAG: hypothetical protein EOP10_34855 [Proteobacteria bacterium]|nr:MAG: hypothetical protein EOP10_34855 [Pseudomonadota bacterium]